MGVRIRAIGFDIDGTLYPNWMMFVWSAPSFLAAPLVTAAFSRTRTELRLHPPEGPFRKAQAETAAAFLRRDPAEVERIIDTRLYRLWDRTVAVLRPFPRLRETLAALNAAGYPLGVLSDFPPGRKLEVLKVARYFACAVSAEDTGRLKPDPLPFIVLAKELGYEPGEILYVGNSYSKDIMGAKGAGMRTALLAAGRKGPPAPEADIVFSRYAELLPAIAAITGGRG